MTDETTRILLPLAASKALADFAERIGQDPQALAAEAVERFIAEEEPFAASVLKALDDFHSGRSVSFDEAMRGFEDTIKRAARKRA